MRVFAPPETCVVARKKEAQSAGASVAFFGADQAAACARWQSRLTIKSLNALFSQLFFSNQKTRFFFFLNLFFFSLSLSPPAPARRSEQEKTINHLPDEVLVHVLSYLPRFSDNLAARLVSRRWRDAAKDMSVVRNYFKVWFLNEDAVVVFFLKKKKNAFAAWRSLEGQ
jgi:hypothetical protein